MFWLGLITGLWFGACVGAASVALVVASRKS